MRFLLIVYPHWPPSNLAGVHRPRLISNFLQEFGWHPIILTVHEEAYEEPLDWALLQTVNPETEVIKVKATKVIKMGRQRIIGDIGLRSLIPLYRMAKSIIKSRHIDFIWIPIPAFYTALLGRWLYETTGTPYGIDYIDPWVSKLAIHEKKFSRAWWSNQIAKILEPVAVRKAKLISGVSENYYRPVLERNFAGRAVVDTSMPYGFDPNDHKLGINDVIYPWQDKPHVLPFVYAGAFLPQSHLFLQLLFRALKKLLTSSQIDSRVHLFFLGTGQYGGKQISDYAQEEGVSENVTEINHRFPFLHILNILSAAQGLLVIGSTERHYTASKTFQALLSHRAIFAIFHEESSAVRVMHDAEADAYTVLYHENLCENDLYLRIETKLLAFFENKYGWEPKLDSLDAYSARASARTLSHALELALSPSV